MACTSSTGTKVQEQSPTEGAMQPDDFSIERSHFGTTAQGQSVEKYQLKNPQGSTIEIITYGGIITSWTAPNRDGKQQNVVLGYDKLADYIRENPYFGAIIGRYGNRITKGQFTLAGNAYQLETNDGPNHLHGGVQGFDKVIWAAEDTITGQGATLLLRYRSADGEGGYPGQLDCTVRYTLTADHSLRVDYEATTDQHTIVNLTQHTYFNLSGDFSQTIEDHQLLLPADRYLPVDATLIPTGALASVEGTPFDFRRMKSIGQDIAADDEQLLRGKGYDHCWAMGLSDSVRLMAQVLHPGSGRLLEIHSNEPGIQFYSGNFLDGTLPRPGGGTYPHRSGLCLETQHYPDSPNQSDFPSVTLLPGERYQTTTIFTFTTTDKQ